MGSIAGAMSPLFFGAVYAWTVRLGLPHAWSGAAFLIAAAVLLAAALIGWAVARPSGRAEARAGE